MQKNMLIKAAIIGLLCLLFSVGLALVSNLVDERKSYQESVIDNIKHTHVGSQVLMTPFLVVEYAHSKGGGLVATPIFTNDSKTAVAMRVSNDNYRRGIYRAIDYRASLDAKAHYHLPAIAAPKNTSATVGDIITVLPSANTASETTNAINSQEHVVTVNSDERVAKLRLIVPVSDLRGVSAPQITVNGKPYAASFGYRDTNQTLPMLQQLSYVSVVLDHLLVADKSGAIPALDLVVDYALEVAGIGSFEMVPLGDDVAVSMTGNWDTLKFFGDALPANKSYSASGFAADWTTPFLAQSNISTASCNSACAHNFHVFGVDFVDAANGYVRIDRTIKYALLLLLVSFATFFLLESIKGLKIHPVQYALIAAALLVFYVLLLSLSEYVLFWQAYAVAMLACVTLIGWYASFMLHSRVRGLLFALLLAMMYVLFYVILAAHEFNLLLGALFAFLLVFVAMLVTRRVDWYRPNANA